MNHKQFKVIPTTVGFEPDKVYDTYINTDENLQINISIYNAILLKDMQVLFLPFL